MELSNLKVTIKKSVKNLELKPILYLLMYLTLALPSSVSSFSL